MLPPIPTWDGLHPLIVHFPIALLLVAPVLVIVGLVLYRHYLWFAISALVLMILGTAAAFVAVSTGEAAGELALRTPEINAALERHEALAETTQWVFLGLTILFALLVFVPQIVKRPLKRLPGSIVAVVFLLIYSGGMLLVANTGHAGGRLVHEFGVQALVAETPADAASGFSLGDDDADED